MINLLIISKLENKKRFSVKLSQLFILLSFSISILLSAALYAGPNDVLTPTSGTTVAEVEDNDETPFDITSYFDLDDNKQDVLVTGEISDTDDVDQFMFTVQAGSSVDFSLNVKSVAYNDITLFKAGDGFVIFVTDNNTIWSVLSGSVAMLFSSDELAEGIAELDLDQIVINDICITEDNDILIAFDEVVYKADLSKNLEILYSASDIQTATGGSGLEITTIAASETYVYFADNFSLNILQGDLDSTETDLSVIADDVDMVTTLYGSEANIISSFLGDSRKLMLSEDYFSSTTGTFRPTDMIKVSGSDIYDDGFYCTEFSPSLDGNGGIKLISPDQDDPNEMVYSEFMADDSNIVHPTCLALDTSGSFGNYIYMANFGPQLGNNFDGKVYQIDADGNATEIVSLYLDENDAQATKGTSNPQDVTGFYDVIDLKFSNNFGDYGDYLYVLSENIDDGTDLGSDSDIWRIDTDGVAHLFVEGVMAGAGKIVFDTAGTFGGKMIIVPWYGPSDIVTVDADGTVTTLYTEITDHILGAEISPTDSIFGGSLLLTINGGEFISLDYDPNDILEQTVWASDLPTGEIPGGDIIFDGSSDMYLLAGDEDVKGILKFSDYDLTSKINKMDIHEVAYNTDNDLLHQPHFALKMNDIFGIYKIDYLMSDPEQAALVDPQMSEVIGSSEFDEDDTIDSIGFCFAPEGDCFIYSNAGKWVKTAAWNLISASLGSFSEITAISHENISDVTYQEYPEYVTIEVMSGDSPALYGVTSNGLDNLPDNVLELPTQYVDDDVVWLGAVEEGEYEPYSVYGADALNRVSVSIVGPGDEQIVNVSDVADPNGVFEYELSDLVSGDYTVTLSSVMDYSGSYEMLIEDKGTAQEIIITEESSNSSITLSNGETVKFSFEGRGQARLAVTYNPDTGYITDIFEIEISGTNSGTYIGIINIDDPHNLDIKYITINSSLKKLSCSGTVETVRTQSTRFKKVEDLDLYNVEEIYLPNTGIKVLQANSLGVKDETTVDGVSEENNIVRAKYISEIDVYEDVYNINFFYGVYTNSYKLINVDGVVFGCNIYGNSITELVIKNEDDLDDALFGTNIYTNNYIRDFTVYTGNIRECNLMTNRGYISDFSINDGDLIDSYIYAGSNSIRAMQIMAGDENPASGNISRSTIVAVRDLKKLYVEGNLEKYSTVTVGRNLSEIILSGDFAGEINAFKLKNMLVGYDSRGRRLSESDVEYTGSDFTGDVFSTLNITEINVTGMMKDDEAGQSIIQSNYGSIRNIFIEDGATGYIEAGKVINTIMIGVLDGNRRKVVNEAANSNLEVIARKLGRIYYTGSRSAEFELPGNPVIVDLNP